MYDNLLQKLKYNTILDEIEFTKRKFTDFDLDFLEGEIDESKFNILKQEFYTIRQLNSAKKIIDDVLDKHSYEYDDFLQEYDEIKDDLKWEKSENSKKIIQLENLVRDMRTEISKLNYNDVFIGRSFNNPLSLNVGGYFENYNSLNEFKKFILSFKLSVNPTFVLETKNQGVQVFCEIVK